MTGVTAEGKSEYLRLYGRRTAFIAMVLVAVVLCAVLSCTFETGYSFSYSLSVIVDHIAGVEYPPRSPEWWADYYICNNVMPGVVMAIIAGAGLALAGAVMQSLLKNPLADAYTMGISSGASLGAVTAIIIGFSYSGVASGFGIVSNAFIGSLLPAIIIIALAPRIGNSPATTILVGTALSFFFNSMVTLIMMTASSQDLQDAFLWQIGSVADASWGDIPLMLAMVIVASVIVQLSYRSLNLLSLGDDTARSLGLDVSQYRMLCILLVSLLVASIISFTGVIGFVGLVAPHMVRFMIGGDNRFVIPASICVGALILVFADLVSRWFYGIASVPIGVVMSFIGAPVFLLLVLRRNSLREAV